MKKVLFIFLIIYIHSIVFAVSLPSDSEIKAIIKISIEQNDAIPAWISANTIAVRNTSVYSIDIIEKSQEIVNEFAIQELRNTGEYGTVYYADNTVFDQQQLEQMKKNGWKVTEVFLSDVTVLIKGKCASKTENGLWSKSRFEAESTVTMRKYGKRAWDCAVWK